MSNDILAHREGGILTLTFNRLDKKNAITRAMYSALAEALEAAATDDSVRVAVIQGDPTCFTAGNDLMDFLSNPPDMTPGAEPAPVVRFLDILRDFPKPLIAAVAGPAVGIGTTLLLHCDLVYAGDNAGFSLPFVNLVCARRPAPACCCRKSWATSAPLKSCCSVSLSRPKTRWTWAWSTACCRPPRSMPMRRHKRPSWRPSRPPRCG